MGRSQTDCRASQPPQGRLSSVISPLSPRPPVMSRRLLQLPAAAPGGCLSPLASAQLRAASNSHRLFAIAPYRLRWQPNKGRHRRERPDDGP